MTATKPARLWRREYGQPFPDPPQLRFVLFHLGDCLFLTLVSALATLVMQIVHRFDLPLVFMFLAGMIAAMAVQTLLALCVAPVLGSIESMVPSMVAAMFSPMAVCILSLLGRDSTSSEALALGAALGVGIFLFLGCYGRLYRRSLRSNPVG